MLPLRLQILKIMNNKYKEGWTVQKLKQLKKIMFRRKSTSWECYNIYLWGETRVLNMIKRLCYDLY